MAQNGYFSLIAQGLHTEYANSVSNTTTTSTSDSVLLGITPVVAGSYVVLFVGTIGQNSGGNSVTTSFYNNGVQDTKTIIDAAPFAGGTLTSGSASVPWVTIGGPYTVNGSQTINLQWHVSAGTGSAQQRQLYAFKVG